MTTAVLTASGTAADVCEKLRILAAIFPKGATLAEVATATRYARLNIITRKQLEEIERRHKKQ